MSREAPAQDANCEISALPVYQAKLELVNLTPKTNFWYWRVNSVLKEPVH